MSTNEYEILIRSNAVKIMREKGLKQGFVAQKMGWTDQKLSSLLNGGLVFKVSYIPALANALGVSAGELYQHDGDN